MDNSIVNPIREAIVLAGGLGTRLRESIGEMPKPLAPINHIPFLHYVFKYMKSQGIETAILSVGYKWEMIEKDFGTEYLGIKIKYAVEEERLGTGGGIKLALGHVNGENCYVLNGDTFFSVDLKKLGTEHLNNNAECTLAAKSLTNFDRYGTIDISSEGVVDAFNEKMPKEEGIINGGIYCLNKSILETMPNTQKFSFETDYLEYNAASGKIKAVVFDDYFMDIGIPVDYEQFANDQLKAKTPFNELNFDKSWTLFLDRDGVINERLIDNYVKQLNELRILDGVPQAIADFNKVFKRIVVVTNQQGIGKGWMDENDLEIIHGYMNNVFKDAGGEVSKFYFAPQLVAENSNYRKPGTGMGLHAQKDYPDIDFDRCLMIGDSESDIEFGMKLGMTTIMLTSLSNLSTKADYIFNNLQAVAETIKTKQE